jgi:hypothetical protein
MPNKENSKKAGTAGEDFDEVVDQAAITVGSEEEVLEVPTLDPVVVVEESKGKPAKKTLVLTDEVVESGAQGREVRVTFIVDHDFNIGTVRHEMKKGDKMKVELHIANLFAQRSIAYIV